MIRFRRLAAVAAVLAALVVGPAKSSGCAVALERDDAGSLALTVSLLAGLMLLAARRRNVASAIVVVMVGVAACSSTLQSNADGGPSDSGGDAAYPVTFRCLPDGGADCPSGQPCPEVPLSSSSCGDLPGVLGHPATPQTVGRPIGCVVGLSYGNPYFSNTQVECYCTDFADMVSWQCPI